MDLRRKLSFFFALTAIASVIVTVAFQMVMPGVGGAILLALLVAAGLAAAFGYLCGRSLSSALDGLRSVIQRLTKWDTTGDVPHVARRDEVGALAKALEAFQADAISWSESHQSEQDSQIEGRLASQKRTEELIHQFRGSIAGILGAFAESAKKMDATARVLSSVATDTNERVTVVASASDEASANVQSVAATAEELAMSFSDIGSRVATASNIVDQVTENARTANQKVQGLSTAAQRIGDVVNLIQDVAAQSNLLALNATIEAARAGGAGRGFAVVAQEVKALAGQTAHATERIAEHVAAIQEATSTSVEAIGAITATMKDAESFTASIAVAVEQQAAATNEIARSVSEAARGTETVATNMKQLKMTVGETDQSAAQVHQAADDMASQSRDLSDTIEDFLRKVAAA